MLKRAVLLAVLVSMLTATAGEASIPNTVFWQEVFWGSAGLIAGAFHGFLLAATLCGGLSECLAGYFFPVGAVIGPALAVSAVGSDHGIDGNFPLAVLGSAIGIATGVGLGLLADRFKLGAAWPAVVGLSSTVLLSGMGAALGYNVGTKDLTSREVTQTTPPVQLGAGLQGPWLPSRFLGLGARVWFDRVGAELSYTTLKERWSCSFCLSIVSPCPEPNIVELEGQLLSARMLYRLLATPTRALYTGAGLVTPLQLNRWSYCSPWLIGGLNFALPQAHLLLGTEFRPVSSLAINVELGLAVSAGKISPLLTGGLHLYWAPVIQ